MTRAAFADSIPDAATILLDTSTILAYLSGSERASDAATQVIDGLVRTGRNQALVPAITVTEALVRPLRARSDSAVRLVEDFLLRFPNLRVEPVTVEIARGAAQIRALTAAPTPDALILATAEGAGASVVVANDQSWPGVVERAGLPLRVELLDAP
jgi:predicted nucleic acid-binding protein